ncbi:hypothetical protein C2S51_025948 [Perilla frutescens var. frutescens]|nr:hypothetical protein C2S51_025948 [Perilla frutescens var. frutescens]
MAENAELAAIIKPLFGGDSTTDAESLESVVLRYMRENRKILVAACGTAAAEQFPRLCLYLQRYAKEVKAIVSGDAAKYFDKPETAMTFKVYGDEDDCRSSDLTPLHMELAKQATYLVIAPLDANTLAKMANGVCDDLLTRVVKCWNVDKPLFFVPSMWSRPSTQRSIKTLQSEEKAIMITRGQDGKMRSVADLASILNKAMENHERFERRATLHPFLGNEVSYPQGFYENED